jgi:hypothetical protein
MSKHSDFEVIVPTKSLRLALLLLDRLCLSSVCSPLTQIPPPHQSQGLIQIFSLEYILSDTGRCLAHTIEELQNIDFPGGQFSFYMLHESHCNGAKWENQLSQEWLRYLSFEHNEWKIKWSTAAYWQRDPESVTLFLLYWRLLRKESYLWHLTNWFYVERIDSNRSRD